MRLPCPTRKPYWFKPETEKVLDVYLYLGSKRASDSLDDKIGSQLVITYETRDYRRLARECPRRGEYAVSNQLFCYGAYGCLSTQPLSYR